MELYWLFLNMPHSLWTCFSDSHLICKIFATALILCTSVFFNRQSVFLFVKALCQILTIWELSWRQSCFDSAGILIKTLLNGSFRWRNRQALQRGCSRTGSTRLMPPLCGSWRCARRWVTTCSCQRSTTSWNSQSRWCTGFSTSKTLLILFIFPGMPSGEQYFCLKYASF